MSVANVGGCDGESDEGQYEEYAEVGDGSAYIDGEDAIVGDAVGDIVEKGAEDGT